MLKAIYEGVGSGIYIVIINLADGSVEDVYSSGQERSEDDIRATLDDIYTTWGDIFSYEKRNRFSKVHMKNANTVL